jgi:hypothetical protein
MLEAGFLRFKEVFNNDVLFGVYSKKDLINNPDKIAEACEYIDELYMIYLRDSQKDFLHFFKTKSNEINLYKLPNRNQINKRRGKFNRFRSN